MKLRDIYDTCLVPLREHYPEPEAKAAAALLTEGLYGVSRIELHTERERDVPVDTAELERVVAQIRTEVPVQYILGKTVFYGREFRVDPRVLIPRPETEELVRWIAESCVRQGVRAPQVLDIGCGSGAIALSLAAELPEAAVQGCDLSAGALEVSRENARLLGLEERVSFFRCDILQCRELPPLDIVVSNPPYVCRSEQAQMRPNVLLHEPHEALFVEDGDPLLFYRTVARLAAASLRSGGMLFFEINERFGGETADLLRAEGFGAVTLRRDLFGKERMAAAIKK